MTHRNTILGLVCILALSGPAAAQEKPADTPPAAKPGSAAAATGAAAPADDPRDKAINAQLDRVLPEINFAGQGLADVIDFIRDLTGANIYVQSKALEGAGIGKDAPVTFRARDVKFRAALAKILESVSTDKGKAQFTVEDGQILISTVPDPKHPRATVTVTGVPDKLDRALPEVNFAGQGLADVVEFVRDVSGANIFVNWNALERAGVAKDAPVVVRLKDVKFSTAIKRVLEDVGGGKVPLRATFEENILTITAVPPAPKPQSDRQPPQPPRRGGPFPGRGR